MSVLPAVGAGLPAVAVKQQVSRDDWLMRAS